MASSPAFGKKRQGDGAGKVYQDSLISADSGPVITEVDDQEAKEVEEDQDLEYSDEDLQTLIDNVKDITTLYDLRAEDWNLACYDTIEEWFRSVEEPLLCIFFDEGRLIAQFGTPDCFIRDIFYLLREPSHVFTVANFFDTIYFGHVDDDVAGTILRTYENIYAPVFFQSCDQLPDNVKNRFHWDLEKFLSKVTDVHNKIYGLTVLYVPKYVKGIRTEDALSDKELIRRLEAIVVYWTNQVRTGIQDQEQGEREGLVTIDDEINFWKYRYENLLGIQYQLEDQILKHICDILVVLQSTYIRQFLMLVDEIKTSIKESRSNIDFLNVLGESVRELWDTPVPNINSEIFYKIFNLIRYIWINSPYYNSTERITLLCKSLSNQLILMCRDFLTLGTIFVEKKTRKAMRMIEVCLKLMMKYIKAYVLVSDSHKEYSETPWHLHKAQIFNHVDSFIQRCKDLQEICEAMIIFGRYDEESNLPFPKFIGSKGKEFDAWVWRIEDMFSECLDDVIAIQDRILNVQVIEWYEDVLKFRSKTKEIEVVVENLTNAVFEDVPNVEDGILVLGCLYNFSRKRSLYLLFEQKTIQVYKLFLNEIQDYKEDIANPKILYLAQMPYYSGRAMMIHLKRNRLMLLKKKLDDAVWMMKCTASKDIFQKYEKLIKTMNEKILNIFRNWNVSTGEDVPARLDRPLMCKSNTKSGLLECNIDRSLLKIFRETKLFHETLGFEIPFHIKTVYQKADNIKYVYENVLNVVLDYNRVISSLSDEERLLFKPLINGVERRIAPGLSKLTWAADVVDEYITECSQNTAQLQDFVDDYKACNLKIEEICEKICDSPLLSFGGSKVYELDEYVDYIVKHMQQVVERLEEYYQQIIQFLIVVFEGFEHYIQQMSNQWIKYIDNFDLLFEEALRICCTNSLKAAYELLHGDGTSAPLIKIKLYLSDNRISFKPAINEVARIVSNMLVTIVEALKPLPRLNDKFHVASAKSTSFSEIIANDQDCIDYQDKLNNEVMTNVNQLKDYMKSWEPFRNLWEVDKTKFLDRYEKQNPTALLFDSNLKRYEEVANNVQIMETVTTVYFLMVNCDELKKAILDHIEKWQKGLCDLLYKMTDEIIKKFYSYVEKNSEEVMKLPKDLQQMQAAIVLYDQLVSEIPHQEELFPGYVENVQTLDKHKVPVTDELRNLINKVAETWTDYLLVLEQAEKMINYSKDEFKSDLLESAEKIRQEGIQMLADFLKFGPFGSEWSAADALANIRNAKFLVTKMKAKENEIRQDLAVFGLSLQESAELQNLEKELNAIEVIWMLAEEWDTAWEKYKSGGFWTIETGEMEETAQGLFRKLTKLSQQFKDKNWPIVEDTRLRVDAFRRTLPLLSDLKNPAMRPRHWERVRVAIGKQFDENSPDFNLEAIHAMEFHLFAEDINEISNAATMELQIEKGLKNISDIWKEMPLEMISYKDKGLYKIKTVDDLMQVLEENMTQLSAMKSTRFVQPFMKEVDYWEKNLSYIQETLEVGLMVQRQWLYLENIFFGEDIRKQLPKESEDFDRITEEWREITTYMFYAQKALKATMFKPAPYLYKRCTAMNDRLEQIQRALEKYLETKRHVFPRFYFISNDDMLEILGNSKKPEMVQPHLKKLFDNLNKLKLQKHITLAKPEAVGMFSDDGEYVEFAKGVILDAPAEAWLCDIETAMRVILRQEFKPIRALLKKMLNKRDKWLLPNIGQLCNACSLIQWTTDCTRAVVHAKIMESKKPLKKLRKKQNQVLGKLSELSRQNLTKIQRLKANALITIEIHSRDVIDRLYKANVRDTNSFEWFSQLRFYWDRDTEECIVKQTNTSFKYGYEYNGNSGRLVITPLTDRCYITLTTALHLFRGGSPKGPAGTGKTETVKDLGKAMGMWVIVNNCSEGLDYKSMGKCFSGLAQTGAWGCFDEFNRINIEVLSVVAQQILSILQAISQKQVRFVFEGNEINLKLTCGIFITMNPGYAGRTELPDNLKSMFRPISMMVPDSAIIAENVLFSDGFQNTKLLAKKVYTLYQLAIQQLSKQDHYDFGLRSMVALLRYAGRKRRILSHLPEEQVVYLAMRDMNVARLTSDDTPLFNGIMSDIFPGVSLPSVDYIEMNNAITEHMKEENLQPIPISLTKVIQLYETKNSRHSVMILGRTGTAKTTTWSSLKHAMGKLKLQKRPGFNKVVEFPLNPKALNLGELYGEYNLSTNEWNDGVISAIMRFTCADETPDEKWILFDGPVDAVWIENMNSVMDDNKVLTLINSDRITMPEQVSLLFEVEDLSVASPATVSRCGMVYDDYKDWGWRPYVTSWLNKHAGRGKLFQDTMLELFDFYLTNILEFKRLNCDESIACPEINVVMSLCKLLDIFSAKEYGMNPADEDRFPDLAKSWFLFCMIWSLCCTTNEDGRRKLDSYIREKEGCFPVRDTVYEYFVDKYSGQFMHWEGKLSHGWKYQEGCAFYKITVPTVDTVRYQFIVNALLSNGFPVLLTGPVGTGKTSIAQQVLATLDSAIYAVLNVNMSAQTTSINLQDAIESRTEKRTKGVFVPIGGKELIAFLDDLNMPAKETYGSQPPLELLRQWIDYGFWYDRQKQTRKYIMKMHILASMGPPGGGRNQISERLLSRFNVVNMTFPDEATIARIFGTMLKQHLVEFTEDLKLLGNQLTKTTIDLYNNVIVKMLPTPTKIHYLFNLRDISKVFQGLLRSNKQYHVTRQNMLRLWIHECFRVFYDRLIDDKDREWFFNQMNEQLGANFELTLHSLCPGNEIPICADFTNPYEMYEDLTDFGALKKYIEVQMEEYNVSPGVVRMDLVLFRDAVEHICRIVRVVSQPRGNMLLVGIGGSGRQSLARISAYICEYNTFMITLRKNYRVIEFKDDLKKLYSLTGVDNKATSFLFNDTQVMDESFLEIINNMLSSGEVANLYKPDEFEEVKGRLEPVATKAGLTPSTEVMYAFLIERVRSNMHIILCMSPIGDAFRNRLRQYPALVNCTTIDWFTEWPKEALLEVANKYIADVNFVQTITGESLEKRRGSVLVSSQDKLRIGVALTFATIHDSVNKFSKRMLNEMKRHNYVTPTNYLELVAGYKKMLAEKREETSSQANKLRNGLWKIDDCKSKVKTMSVELEEAQVKLNEFQQECDDYLVIIVAQKKEADEQQREVTKKSIKIGEEEIACQKMADVAQADLDEAMPALNEAIAALDALSKKDISEMKSYGKPPYKVQMVMEAVCILKGTDTTWDSAKRLLGEMDFLKALKEFDRNHITEKTLKKIAGYTSNEEFVPDKVGIVSFAAKSLCMWVIAIEKYARVWKIVGPKQAKLDEAMASLHEKQRMLAEAREKLEEINRVLAKLQKEYEEKLALKEELLRKAEMLRIKLERAAMLVEGLSGERERWQETVLYLDGVYDCLIGDCLLATAFVSYLGPFVTTYRDEMVAIWKKEVADEEITYSPNFNVITFLTDPTSIREWNIQGLPGDDFSTENGIIVTRGSRWPLLIDPQLQGAKWIKAMESKNKLQVIDFGIPDFMRIVERAVFNGMPVLVQNIMETIDPSIQPIVAKEIIRQGGMDLIKIDDKMVSYNQDFRFFMTTKMTNPHYAPEISTKTCLVNFAVKEQGLEGQLLGIVVRKERPQLEEEKTNMVLTIATGKRTLINLENELLRLLNETRGSLLDDADLFNNLQTSKVTAAAVKTSLENSEKTEREIDFAREGYRSCAKRASILFFVLNDLGKIDPMYQFALDSYILLFTNSILKSKKSAILQERITHLNEYHTYAVYRNTCRALFETHKLLFSFHMCIKILEAQGKIVPYEYNFLLKGGVVLDRDNQIDNPNPWLNEVAWDNITELDKLQGFHGIIDTFENYPRDWYLWYTHTEPETLPLVGEWNDICNEFQKMLFVRSLRQDRVSFCISNFIVNQLGPQFIEPPVLDIKAVLEESVPQTPLIFVLSPGVDPTNSLIQLSESAKMGRRFYSCSLGQGQAPVATKMLQQGAKEGHWVFLANCHLSLSWMPKLDKIVDTMQVGRVHDKFRLWLSSSPHPDFPISILQTGIKMTTEPPKGIKANLKRLYQLITEDQFNVCQTKEKYKKLLFSLCFFHAILLERKKFQQLGWNVIYSFNDSDFEVSENLLTIYLDEYQTTTPWDALKYLIAGVNYGGHVTDDWDRRLLMTYINQYFCDDAIFIPFHRLSSLTTYYIPKDGSIQSYQDYITLLPNVDRPEAFGQHSNADITSLISESRMLFETLMSLQIRVESSEEISKEEKVSQLATDVLSKLPPTIDYERTEKLIGAHKKPLDVVLLQEIQRFDVLLVSIFTSLEELQKGILGLVVMSSELEEIFTCMFEGRVPSGWLKAYPSLKLLGSWTRDLVARVEHFSTWAETTHPPLFFWLSAYTFPTGYLTAVLQTAARQTEVPIDTLSWEFTILTVEEHTIQIPPDNGVYVRGMYLEGAGWDRKNATLIEPQPMQLVCPMPLIHFKPMEVLKKKTKGLYSCPCYYYPIRSGTGARPAYVVAVDLKSGAEHPDFWTKRGTALLLSLAT